MSLRRIYKNCCICGMRFEDTDGETETCGKVACVDKYYDQLEEENNNDY